MRHETARPLLWRISVTGVVLLAAIGGCSGPTSVDANGGGDDGGDAGSDAAAAPDAVEDGRAAGGAIACSTPAGYAQNWVGRCGVSRWSVKTGTDSAAPTVNLVPQDTTIAAMVALPAPATLPYSNRIAPTELITYKLTNVTAQYARLEDDSDYHLVVSDGTHTMIVEVPYPGCVGASSPFACFVTHARAVEDTALSPTPSGKNPNLTATMIGVGFFDDVHGQAGVAPNGVELHPVLAICFGKDCTP